MTKRTSQIVAAAGEHFVAFRLAKAGYVVAIPRGGSPSVDLLVSNDVGTRTLAVQVKTTSRAVRRKGLGKNRNPHHLEFPLGSKATTSDDSLVYVFVDLREGDSQEIPDAYVVPSAVVAPYCLKRQGKPLIRWHPTLEDAAPYKNGWQLFSELLKSD